MKTATNNFTKPGRKSSEARPKAPRPNRELKARMALAGVDAKYVSRKTGISYARCSEIISGTRRHEEKFAAVWAFVFSLPIH